MSGTGPERPVRGGSPDRHAWAWSAAVAAATGLAVMAFTLWWMPVVHGAHRWSVGGDIWLLTEPGRFVSYGAFGYLYSAVDGFYALPLPAVLMAPAVRLVDHLHLIEGFPFPVARPTAWMVVGPWEMLAGLPALHAVRRTAAGAGLRPRSLLALQAWVAATVVAPTLYWGHPEDLLALAFLLYSLQAARRGAVTAASVLLGLAVCSKQWSVVAVPFLVLQVPPGRRLRAVAIALGLPVLLAAVPLAVDWPDASRALFAPKVPLHLATGHRSLVLPVLVAAFGAHGSILGRVLEVAVAPAVAQGLRRRSSAAQMGGLGVVLLTRLVLEPVVFPYYVGPALVVLVLAAATGARRLPAGLMWWSAVLTAWCLPASARSGWWWSGTAVILLAATGWVVRTRRSPVAPPEPLGLTARPADRAPAPLGA